MRRIQILKTGDAISDNGTPYNFSSQALQEIADTYNPQNFKAPVIVSYPAHNTQGIPDSELHVNKQLAFGAPDYLEVVGDKLFAVFTELTKPINQVFDWIKDRQILGFSASIYPPSSPVNPYPGNHALRHIASCGVNPPAIKGMGVDFAESLAFKESDADGALNFQSPVNFGMGNHHLMSIMRSLKDKFIDLYGLEQTEKVIPSLLFDEMAMGDECSCDLSEVREQLAQLTPIHLGEPMKDDKGKKDKDYDSSGMDDEEDEETKDMSEATALELSEAQAENERLKAQIEAQKLETAKAQTALRQREIASFTEHLTPAQKADVTLSFGEGDGEDLSLETFLLELNERHYSFMKGWIEGLPNLVQFGEVATDDKPVISTGDVEELNQRILSYAEEHGLEYAPARRAVLSQVGA